jgi:hypothetical protein
MTLNFIATPKVCLVMLCLVILSACGTLKNSPKYQLSDDVYAYREKNAKYEKAWVYVKDDTISIVSYRDQHYIQPSEPNIDLFFLKRSFDIDVMTVGFKYRPATLNLPRQLTTDFNGNVYLGYRFDRFKVRHKSTPLGVKKIYSHRGITGGLFGGIGSTAVTPWTTNNLVADEYNGFTISRGLALMVGINSLTVGFGIGWDALTDRDKSVWIYQNKPWYGLTVGLNLN